MAKLNDRIEAELENIQEVLKSTEHFLQHKPQSIRAQ